MRIVLLILLLLSLNAQAVEVDGVTVDDTVHLGSSNLILNGVGVRSKFVFDWYVAALYLPSKKSSLEAVLMDPREKRIALYVLDEINAEDLLYTLSKGIRNNSSDAELKALKDDIRAFELVFHRMGTTNKGDIILIDYIPDIGTQVTVNNVVRVTLPGSAFYAAVLKIWLGANPTQDDLKLKLLGGK